MMHQVTQKIENPLGIHVELRSTHKGNEASQSLTMPFPTSLSAIVNHIYGRNKMMQSAQPVLVRS